MTALLPPSQETADFTVNIGRADNLELLRLVQDLSDAAFRRPELRQAPHVAAFVADAAEYSDGGLNAVQLPLAAMLGACVSRMAGWVRPIDGGTCLLFRDLRGDFSSSAVARVIQHFLYVGRSTSVVRWTTARTPDTDQRATSNSFIELWCVSAVQVVSLELDVLGRKVGERMSRNALEWQGHGCPGPVELDCVPGVRALVLSDDELLLAQRVVSAVATSAEMRAAATSAGSGNDTRDGQALLALSERLRLA